MLEITEQARKMLEWYNKYISWFGHDNVVVLKQNSKYKDIDVHQYSTWEKVVALINGGQLGLRMTGEYFCLDFDSKDAYQRWLTENPAYEWTATAETPNGYHVLFQVSDPQRHPPISGKSKEVDVITDGWYIAVFPSIHPSGQQYKWVHEPYQGKDSIYTVQNINVLLKGIDKDAIKWDVPDYEYYEDDREDFDEWE